MEEQSHNILIVDDDEAIRRVLERQLRGPGRHIISASSAHEGLVRLSCFDFSIVLSDHLMPDMTGLEFLGVVRRRFPAVVRILVTGHADLDTAIDCINRGEIYRFMVKPWELASMQATIKLALEKFDRDRIAERLRRKQDKDATFAEELERHFPGLTSVPADGAVVVLS